jgi:Pregnancy-associated plasma protein-A
MRFSHFLRLTAAAGLGTTAFTVVALAAPAQARPVDTTCLTPTPNAAAASARGGASGLDHRDITAAEQQAIMQRTSSRLTSISGATASSTRLAARVRIPVHVHVMRDRAGRGNVTRWQVTRQIEVLNNSYRSTRFRFRLASLDRFKNTAWHHDRQSARYRARTRTGGANALNIWLVDFQYLGIATFPWDYPKKRRADGIRVHFGSLPGGRIANFNRGQTATHEAGHWLGLFHTFQGGCTELNDQVNDTPAQASPTSGCPAGRDSCTMSGMDPIHNYMDYSFDRCYREFTRGQASRVDRMWAAYRA